MKITVKMDEKEFLGYIAFKEDKTTNERETQRICDEIMKDVYRLAEALHHSVDYSRDDPDHPIRILDQNILRRAISLAEEFLV